MSGKNPLTGAWQLERWEIAYGDGRAPGYPYGADASGLLVYTDDGHMSAVIARAGRGRLSSASVRSAPEGERLAAFESYFHYAGRYEIDHGAGCVTHRVTHALNPNFVGSEQRRDMALDGDLLTLSASDTIPGSDISRHHRLIWRRA